MTPHELGVTKILESAVLTGLIILSFLHSGISDGFANGVADVTSDNLFNLLEPKIQDLIVSKHLEPQLLNNMTLDYSLLPTIFLYNGNLTGLSQFHNESVRSSWNPHSRMVNMELQLIFPQLKMSYEWRSLMGKGSLFYIIYDMLLDLSFVLDLQSLQLKIQDTRFNNHRASTEIAVRSKFVTNILNALRNRLKGLNNWVLNPVTEKMNEAILGEVKVKNIDIYELLGIKHLYHPTVDPLRSTVDPFKSMLDKSSMGPDRSVNSMVIPVGSKINAERSIENFRSTTEDELLDNQIPNKSTEDVSNKLSSILMDPSVNAT